MLIRTRRRHLYTETGSCSRANAYDSIVARGRRFATCVTLSLHTCTRGQQYGRRGYNDHFQEEKMHYTRTHATRMGMQAHSTGEKDGLCADSAAQPQSLCNHARAARAACGVGGGKLRHTQATAGATMQLPSAGEGRGAGGGTSGVAPCARWGDQIFLRSCAATVLLTGCERSDALKRASPLSESSQGESWPGAAEQRAIVCLPSTERRASCWPQRGPLPRKENAPVMHAGWKHSQVRGAEPCKRMWTRHEEHTQPASVQALATQALALSLSHVSGDRGTQLQAKTAGHPSGGSNNPVENQLLSTRAGTPTWASQ
jgi:hypothetical protein